MAVVEGKNAVLEALRGGRTVKGIFIADNLRPDSRLDEIGSLAAEQDVSIRIVPRRELDSMSVRGAHQGVVARMESFRYANLDEILASISTGEPAVIVVADGVTDPQNLGSMIRTCEVAGAAALVVAKRRSAHVGAATAKAAAGAAEHLPVARVTNLVATLDRLKDAGFWIAGAADDADLQMWEADLSGRVALVFGSEGKGLGRLVRERCDWIIRVPTFGRIGSLNVAAATAVILYEVVRQQRHGAGKRRREAGPR